MQDTSRAQAARYFELLRQQTPVQRLETTASLSAVVRELAMVDIATRFSDTSIRERQWHLADRLYGRPTASLQGLQNTEMPERGPVDAISIPSKFIKHEQRSRIR